MSKRERKKLARDYRWRRIKVKGQAYKAAGINWRGYKRDALEASEEA